MKNLNPRPIILFLGFLLLSSCVVKSLHAFYTQENINFEKEFIGTWEDNENSIWKVLPFQEAFLKENKKNKPDELNDNDLELYNTYKNGYIVNYKKDDNQSIFLVIPFNINKQLFLDFTIIEVEKPEINVLTWLHFTPIHSLAKFNVLPDKNISIKWFDEDKIKKLFEQNKTKIKHEIIGIDDTILLTASSEELQKFIEKHLASNDDENWETNVELKLHKIDVKP